MAKKRAPQHLRKKKRQFSKIAFVLTLAAGFIISQECIFLMAYAIRNGFTATAAYLTAAVGLAEAVIGGALALYNNLTKHTNTVGGITFEAAKATGFSQSASSSATTDNYNVDSPPI